MDPGSSTRSSRIFQCPSVPGGFAAGFVGFCRGSSVDGAVRANSVVVVAEAVELGLQVTDRVGSGLVSEPFFQGLLEPLDLALGLGVVRAAVLLVDSEQVEFVLERVSAATDSGGEDEAVVGQCGGGWPVVADGGPELGMLSLWLTRFLMPRVPRFGPWWPSHSMGVNLPSRC
jgi:hypothetical protein